MLRRRDEQIRKELPAFKGGKGAVQASVLLTSEELLGKGRVFNCMVLEQGSSIGPHTHEGDAEIFYILSGRGVAHVDGREVVLEPGDLLYTGDGHSHDLRNDEADPLEFLAVILYT